MFSEKRLSPLDMLTCSLRLSSYNTVCSDTTKDQANCFQGKEVSKIISFVNLLPMSQF